MAKILQTMFPLNYGKDFKNILESVENWIIESPHHKINRSVLKEIYEKNFSHSDEKSSIESLIQDNYLALNFVNNNEEDRYITELVCSKDKNKLEIAISLHYESKKIGHKNEGVRKPRIINRLIEELGGGYDGSSLTVNINPVWLQNYDLEFVSEILKNESDNKLPVIYCSRDKDNWCPANPRALSILVGGLAHVLVEPNREFSYELREKTDGLNVYGGAIGIYWPIGTRKLLFPDKYQNCSKKINGQIYYSLLENNIYQVLPHDLTFAGVKSLRDKKRLEELAKSPMKKDEELLEIYLSELATKESRIKELEEALGMAHKKVVKTQISNKGGLVKNPGLVELYPDEIAGIIYDALEKYNHSYVMKDSRRKEILDKIIKANKEFENISKDIKEEIKNICKTSHNFNDFQRKMSSLGFEFEKNGGHPKIFIPGYENLKCTLPLTPSDWRSTRNAASEINKNLL